MALDRKYQKIFAKNADGNDLVVVGSKNAGNPDTSTDVETIQSLSNWETGLRVQVTSNDAPYLQDQNSIFYVITSQLAYLFQAGIAEWNAQTEYVSGRSIVLRDGKIYMSIANSVGIEPEVTNGWGGYWQPTTTKGSYYAYCSASEGSAIKEITINDFVLSEGAKITVKFGFGSDVPMSNNPYLKINVRGQVINLLIKVGDMSSSVQGQSSFVCKNTGIVEFTYYKDGGVDYAYCDNVVAEEMQVSYSQRRKIYRNGWCEQSGIVDNGSDARSLDKTISFYTEYIDTNYIFNFTATRSGTADHCVGAVGTKSKTTSSIIASYYGNGSSELARYIMWEAKGYKRLNIS